MIDIKLVSTKFFIIIFLEYNILKKKCKKKVEVKINRSYSD